MHNLDQAVARLNATGSPGPDLGPAVAYCMTGPEHYLRAEELLSGLSTTHPDPETIATA
jgi:hypothetical protein